MHMTERRTNISFPYILLKHPIPAKPSPGTVHVQVHILPTYKLDGKLFVQQWVFKSLPIASFSQDIARRHSVHIRNVSLRPGDQLTSHILQ